MSSLIHSFLKINFITPFILFNFISTFFSLFLAGLFIDQHIEIKHIAAHYILVFSIPAIVIHLSKNSASQIFLIALSIIIPVIFLLFSQNNLILYSISMSLASGLIITSRDQIAQVFQHSMANASIHSGYSFQRLNTFSTFITITLSVFFSLVASFLINQKTLLWILIASIWAVSILSFYKGMRGERPLQKEIGSITKESSEPIPISVTSQCFYSTIIGAAYYIGKFFLLPYMIIEASSRFGLEKYSFTLVASIIGALSVLALIGRSTLKSGDIENIKMMKYGYRINASLWGILFLCGYYIDQRETTNLTPYILILISYLGIEISSKFWSIGFFGVLKDQADFYSSETNDSYKHRKYLSRFSVFKSMGGVAGFSWVFLTYPGLSLYLSAAAIAGIAIIYDVVISNSYISVLGRKRKSPVKT